MTMRAILDTILLYGQYPATLSHPNDVTYLKIWSIVLFFKDLSELSLLIPNLAALPLLKLLAYQIGSLRIIQNFPQDLAYFL